MKERALPRKPVVLSETTQRRLGMYALAASAAGVGMLAQAEPAEAKIVYTPTHVRLTRNAPFPIDLNHDGTVDFYLNQYYVHTGQLSLELSACQTILSGSWAPFCYSNPAGANAIRVTKSKHLIFSYAADFRQGVVIGGGDKFGAPAELGRVESGPDWFGPWMNSGKGVKNRYLGLKFKIGSRFHFGWARISVKTISNGAFATVLTGYAYETVPNRSIIAGKTKGPDVITMPLQTGTLGHLALGRK